jgi:DNA-binding NtrC family response regulator
MADFHQTATDQDRAPRVRDDSPNYLLHAHHYQPQGYDAHWLLYSEPENTRQKHVLAFQKRIAREFSRNRLVVHHLGLASIGDLSEVRDRVAALLQEAHRHGAIHLDVFFATGTAAMVLAWYICHETLQLPTRLVSFTPPNFGYYQDRPPLMEVRVEQSPVPLAATIRQRAADAPAAPLVPGGAILTEATRPVYELASQVASSDCRVVIYGETGTGKELLARHIHLGSDRRDQRFEAINCAALAKGTLEAQLFGYAKGAFTGADRDTPGIFEQVNGGTLLLDEVGEMPPEMQVALLRVLQEGKVRRIQDPQERPVDVRLIAATHRDLLAGAGRGTFRPDLYHRLAIVELELPALREYAPHDRRAVLNGLLAKAAHKYGRPALALDPEAEQYLVDYPYPGNIREMEALAESLYVLAGQATLADLPLIARLGLYKRMERRRAAFASAPGGLLPRQQAEREQVAHALDRAHTLEEARQLLGFGSINTLKARMKELGLLKEQFPNIRWRG